MSEHRHSGEYHRADPQYRKRMQAWLGFTLVAGVAFLLGLWVWLGRLDASVDLERYEQWLNRLLAGLCLMLAAASAGFGLWLHRLARACKQERRWPPTTMRTSADVRIRYLTSADALVTQMRAGAFALGLFALALSGWSAWLLWSR